MSQSPLFPNFDGLMSLAKREGVDIRPTLLRVLTDLYIQAPAHSFEDKRKYTELATRLIDEVDDATRSVVRAKLAVYPHTPTPILRQLGLEAAPLPKSESLEARAEAASATVSVPVARAPSLSMQPSEAASIEQMFASANASERIQILRNLEESAIRPATRIDEARAKRGIAALEAAAFAQNRAKFTADLAIALALAAQSAQAIVDDAGGEPLACAAKALDMPSDVFQRILMFLKPELGASVMTVFRLARLYDSLSDRASLIMVAIWRGATTAQVRAKHRPALYDDERRRARAATAGTSTQSGNVAQPVQDRFTLRK